MLESSAIVDITELYERIKQHQRTITNVYNLESYIQTIVDRQTQLYQNIYALLNHTGGQFEQNEQSCWLANYQDKIKQLNYYVNRNLLTLESARYEDFTLISLIDGYTHQGVNATNLIAGYLSPQCGVMFYKPEQRQKLRTVQFTYMQGQYVQEINKQGYYQCTGPVTVKFGSQSFDYAELVEFIIQPRETITLTSQTEVQCYRLNIQEHTDLIELELPVGMYEFTVECYERTNPTLTQVLEGNEVRLIGDGSGKYRFNLGLQDGEHIGFYFKNDNPLTRVFSKIVWRLVDNQRTTKLLNGGE